MKTPNPRLPAAIGLTALWLFAGSPFPARGEFAPELAEEFIGGKYIRYLRQRMLEGDFRMVTTCWISEERFLNLHVKMTHIRAVPKDLGILQKLEFSTTGVKAKLRVTGKGVQDPGETAAEDPSTDPTTGISRVEIPWSGEVLGEEIIEEGETDPAKPKQRADPWTGTVTLWAEITEPQGSQHPPLSVPIRLPNLRRAECVDGLRGHKEAAEIARRLEAIEQSIDAQRKNLKDAQWLRDDLNESLRIAESYLDNATYFLNAVDKAAAEFEKAFEDAEKAEDILGLLQLGAGLGKAGWKILTKPKFKDKLAKALTGSPKDLMQFKRALSTHGGQLPPELLGKAAALDAKRLEAVKEAVESMGLRLDDDIKFIGSARGKMDELFGRGGPAKKWNGLESDIDVEFVGASVNKAEDFKRLLAQRLEAKGLGKVDDVGDLSVNFFAGNLSDYDILTKDGLAGWINRVKSPAYITTKDAYRTYGSQRLAKYYGASEDAKKLIRFDPVDGYEMTKEMAARAETIWKTKNRLDKKVFKDIKKHYERALLGMEIRKGNPAATADIIHAIENNPLLRQAKTVADAGTADRRLAKQMMDAIRDLDRGLGDVPDMVPNRKAVFDYGKKVMDIERTGDPGLLYSPLQKYRVKAAVEDANRLWADELQLPKWTDYSLAQEVGADTGLLGLGGLLKVAGNPITAGMKEAAWYWMEPGAEDIKDARQAISQALKTLVGAEKRWEKLLQAVEQLKLNESACQEWEDQLRKSVQELPEDVQECFELVVNSQISQFQDDFQDLITYVTRIKKMREGFSQKDMMAQLDKRPEMAAFLAPRRQEYVKIKEKLDSLYAQLANMAMARWSEESMKPTRDQAKRLEEARDVLGREIAQAEAFIRACDRLERTLPKGLQFNDLAIALANRMSENLLGQLSGKGLLGYCTLIKETLRSIRSGQASLKGAVMPMD